MPFHPLCTLHNLSVLSVLRLHVLNAGCNLPHCRLILYGVTAPARSSSICLILVRSQFLTDSSSFCWLSSISSVSTVSPASLSGM